MQVIEEDQDEDDVAHKLPEKPKYFDMFDEDLVDSEDEMVSGENNYIEIKCLPLEGEKKPEPPANVPAPAEEEKKAAADENKEDKPDGAEEAKAEAPAANANPPAAAPVDEDESVFCRFCWDDTNVIENPLLSVCKCSGGVGFVHYTCLKYWLKTKMTENKTYTSVTIFWKTFGCEICQQIYPYIFKANGRKYSLVEIQKPNSDYIMMESLTLEKSTSRIIQILKPHMRVHTFKLGRGLDQDLRINDISVSRYHAQIKFMKDKFVLLDNLSKFGTLVMVKGGLHIYPG